MIQYALSYTDGRVYGFARSDTMPVLPDGRIAHVLLEPVPFFPKSDTPTQVLYVANNELFWVETGSAAQLRPWGLDAVDTAADAARAAVLVKSTQEIEYTFAERDARAYRAAGYTGEPGRGVSGWAAAKHRDNWTARAAADDILGVADRWEALLYDIRDLRLAAKEDIRHAESGAEIHAIVTGFSSTLTAAMQGIA